MRHIAALICIVVSSLSAQSTDPLPTAAEVWERAVEAKGGRERLYSVENAFGIVRRNGKLRGTSLTVLPDKYWDYSDMRPSVFGIWLAVGDRTGHWHVSKSADSSGADAVRHGPLQTYLNGPLALQAFQMLESRWHKPVIKDLDSERIGRRDYWVVTAQVETHEILYYIDKETHLVRRIREPQGGRLALISASGRLDLLDYETVQGLQMATRLISHSPLTGRNARNVEWQFNVEYAPDLFERKPHVEDGPFGWQPSQAEEHLAPLRPAE